MSDWYVRPSGGTYGDEDGTSYANAWDGFSNITWGVGGVVVGDTLYLDGTFYEQLMMTDVSKNIIFFNGQNLKNQNVLKFKL